MKKYFDFTLTGKKFLPIWLLFYVIVIVPYGFILKSLTELSPGELAQGELPDLRIVFALLGVILVALFISFYIMKISIENVKYGDVQVEFNGKFSGYLGKILLGFLLSVITLFIYMAWFIRDITRFFVNNSSIDSNNFQFKGKGGKLFLILLLTVIIPMVLISLIMGKYMVTINQNVLYGIAYQGIVLVILIPYIYFIYKWMVDVKYKDYQIKWQTNFTDSCVKILIEILLTLITLGIYMPLAYLKLYKYFSEKTIAVKEDSSLRFGYELDCKNDFLFIWGQLLLTIITLGIYYPWAYSKIGKRILSKTYLMKNDAD